MRHTIQILALLLALLAGCLGPDATSPPDFVVSSEVDAADTFQIVAGYGYAIGVLDDLELAEVMCSPTNAGRGADCWLFQRPRTSASPAIAAVRFDVVDQYRPAD